MLVEEKGNEFLVYMTNFGVKSAGWFIFYVFNNRLSLKNKV